MENENKFNNSRDWIQQTNKLGMKYWLNIKTMKESRDQPGVKMQRTNTKIIMERAEYQFMGHMEQ